jgi:hypothetical protein
MGQSAESLLDGEKKKKKWKMEPEVDCKTADHLFSIEAASTIGPIIGQGRTSRQIHHYLCNQIVTVLETQTGFTHKTHPTPPRTRNATNTERRRKEEPQRRTQAKGAENQVDENNKTETGEKTSEG